MNRDCNIESLSYITTDGGTVIRLSDLQDWMADKKIIKKGLQPHPYADVLHTIAENTDTVVEVQIGDRWCLSNISNPDVVKQPLRIKPSEPIYEYQWLVREFDDTNFYVIAQGKYYTEDDNSIC